MTDENNTTNTQKIDSIENMEHYMLYSRGEIIQKLRQLGKKNSLISLHFGEQSMLSTVVDVLTDKSLLVLDYGGNEELNQKVKQALLAHYLKVFFGCNAVTFIE